VCHSERRNGAGRAVTSLLPARQIPGCGDAHLSLTMSPQQHFPFPAPAVLSAPSALPLPFHPASTSAPHSSRTPVPPRIHTAAVPSSRALPYPSHPVAPLRSRHAPVPPHILVPCAPDAAHTIHARLLHCRLIPFPQMLLGRLTSCRHRSRCYSASPACPLTQYPTPLPRLPHFCLTSVVHTTLQALGHIDLTAAAAA
jgi:hypothetical protein